MKGQLYIISAPSGAGKTSLIGALLRSESDLGLSVSHTTRPKRPGEIDGTHYHFINRGQFEAMIAGEGFLEYADVFGNYYGTSHAAIEDVLVTGRDLILEIDWQGAQQVRAKHENVRSIFILPPSRSALLARLKGRGSDSEEVIARRSAEAMEEMSHHDEVDYLVINDCFETALADLQAIFRAERLTHHRQASMHSNQIAALFGE